MLILDSLLEEVIMAIVIMANTLSVVCHCLLRDDQIKSYICVLGESFGTKIRRAFYREL